MRDWRPGDPTWKDGKGKGLIGALNYLAGKGCNAFSFLTYNAGGDGDNVWPFVSRDDKLHYDCSKLDQWGIVFDHATAKGLVPALQAPGERDRRQPPRARSARRACVPESLDGGKLGPRTQALLPRAHRPLRPQPRAELEPRRGEHADHRGDRGHGAITSTTPIPISITSSSTPSPTSRTRSTRRCWATSRSSPARRCRTAGARRTSARSSG